MEGAGKLAMFVGTLVVALVAGWALGQLVGPLETPTAPHHASPVLSLEIR